MSSTADRASAAVHALLLRSPSEYNTLESLVVSAAVWLLVTPATLLGAYDGPRAAGNIWQERRQDLRVTWALWAAGTVLQVTRNATRRAQKKSREAVARRSALVCRQLTVTADMEFSSADYQAAFERWPGHGFPDLLSLVLALLGQLAVTAQLLQRRDVCPPATVLRFTPFTVACALRLLVWRRLSPSQRSWLNMMIVAAVFMYLIAMIYSGDRCLGSLFKNLAATSLMGRLLAQMVLVVMLCVTFSVTVRHMPWHAAQICTLSMAFFHLASPLRSEDPQLRSPAALQQLAALSLWALVLWMLALAIRSTFAEHAMLRFLGSLRSD